MGTDRRRREDPFGHPVLPVQLLDRARPHGLLSPERRLMLAVLADAIVQLRRGGTARTAEERWILASGHSSPFAFTNICDALGIDAPRLARRLLATRLALPPRGGGSRRTRLFHGPIAQSRGNGTATDGTRAVALSDQGAAVAKRP